jgi:hypothetical protein
MMMMMMMMMMMVMMVEMMIVVTMLVVMMMRMRMISGSVQSGPAELIAFPERNYGSTILVSIFRAGKMGNAN